ncbi:rhamnulokinase [Cohnella sp. JJ-181]|uniref:rhamnulokinase n=1 Tax=Cohnella rhizoplanae TaxID=2974897 RepID=UPI0022FF83CA|nr:rhamnulokinase family protein [Cohnella sp. JJ-181]CAI6029831.1 Rhamnulokinase [Cohnella sp. JJ-181]
MADILAYDLGASSGRALLGRLRGGRIETEELHRFPNDPVQVGGRLHWDILRLLHEIKQALLKAKQRGTDIQSIGIDSWGVDFGFIGSDGELLGNPYHYRDGHTAGIMPRVFAEIPEAELFARTGIQFQPFNTIFQLYAMKQANNPLLREARRILMIPDLLRYFLTGELHGEFTNATTTQLYNATAKAWDRELLAKLDLPADWFGPVLSPGDQAGTLSAAVTEELGMPAIPVYAVAEHDTGSAVVAVPALEEHFAYLSCGTWSLIGTEVTEPVLADRARELNFTNEGGACGTYRFLKNIMGLWIVNESRRAWEREGHAYSFPELVGMAEAAPAFASFIDPDDDLFMPPGDMPGRIAEYCRRTGQRPPAGVGETMRCILESLALKYRYALERIEELTGRTYGGLYMVGGGIQNTLLCRWTASAIGKPVWAGPAEGSAIGNLAVQWIASGELADLREARRVIRDSFDVLTYEPAAADAWEDAYGKFLRATSL